VKRIHKTGASHAGLIEWLVQRLTAVYMTVFVVYALIASSGIDGYPQWRAWFANGIVRWSWMLFYLAVLWHGWIGLRSVFLDYIKPFWLRLGLTLVSAVALSLLALWAIDILYIRVAGGGV